MQVHAVFNKELLISYLNDFLEENNLIFFEETQQPVTMAYNRLSNEFFESKKHFMIFIGQKSTFDIKIKKLGKRPMKEDKIDFIYAYTKLYLGEEKITDTVFIWNTSSGDANRNGKLLKKFLETRLKKGMRVVDTRYISLNKTTKNFYWPKEIVAYEDKLFNTGGIVKIEPADI